MTPSPRRRVLILGGVIGLVMTLWVGALTDRSVGADAGQNLRMAWNLARHGVLSTGDAGRPAPDMFREPLTPLITAAIISVSETVAGPASFEAWNSGARIEALKSQNLLWLLLLYTSVWLAARRLGGSVVTGAAALLLVSGFAFAFRSELLDSLGTDLAAAALLTAAATLTLGAWQDRDWRRWLGAGAVFGLAVLVKASLLYVTVGLGGALLLLAAWRKRGWPGDRVGVGVILLLTATALVITPWTARNHRLFGTPAVTDRGGEVLLLRSYEDQATAAEYAGVWCAYSPGRLQVTVCRLTGVSGADLQPGGALGRFSRKPPADYGPIRAVAAAKTRPVPGESFYYQAKARYLVLVDRYAGEIAPLTAADREAKREAIALIAANPGGHLAMTPAFLWRGLGGLTVVLGVIGLAAFLRKRDDLLVFLLPFVGLGLFMALFSHFIPRYAWPMIPAACVALPLIAEAVLRRAVRR